MKRLFSILLAFLLIGYLGINSGCDDNDDDTTPTTPNNNNNNNNDYPTSLTDSRDGKTYSAVRIGDQCWMSENMNHDMTGAMNYDSNANYAAIYGKLYYFYAAKTVCPTGWHLPSDAEWKTMEKALGMTDGAADSIEFRGTDQGTQLKEGGSSGFEAKLGGLNNNYMFFNEGKYGFFWTSTGAEHSKVWVRNVNKDKPKVYREQINEGFIAYSVRCVKD